MTAYGFKDNKGKVDLEAMILKRTRFDDDNIYGYKTFDEFKADLVNAQCDADNWVLAYFTLEADFQVVQGEDIETGTLKMEGMFNVKFSEYDSNTIQYQGMGSVKQTLNDTVIAEGSIGSGAIIKEVSGSSVRYRVNGFLFLSDEVISASGGSYLSFRNAMVMGN